MALKSAERRRQASNGESPFDLAGAPSNGAQRRGSEILIGLLMVVLCSLAAVWIYITSTVSTPYVFVAQDVQRGQRITEADLTTAEIRTEANLMAFGGAERSTVVGKIARIDLSAGSLLSPDQLADEEQIPSGSGVVGLDLEPGAYPARSLRPGDRVRVVAVTISGNSRPSEEAFEILADQAEIVEVSPGAGQDLFVSLLMADDAANRVATAQALGSVRLVKVPEG